MQAGRKSNNAMAGKEWERRRERGQRATKIHFTKFMCGSGSGHTQTHTHETGEISRCRDIKKIKCPEPNHLDEVPGSD